MTWLEIPGASLLHEPANLLADGPESLALLCRALVDQRMPVALQRLDMNGPVRAALAIAARRRSAMATPSGGSCLRVETRSGWPAFLKKISGSRRNTLQRKRRLLEQHGTVSMRCVVPDVGSVREALRTAFEIEARSWKGVGGSAVLQRPQAFEFFVELGRRFAAEQRLEIRLLQVGDVLAASQVGIVADQRWWELKIGYDPRWANIRRACSSAGKGCRMPSSESSMPTNSWVPRRSGSARSPPESGHCRPWCYIPTTPRVCGHSAWTSRASRGREATQLCGPSSQ